MASLDVVQFLHKGDGEIGVVQVQFLHLEMRLLVQFLHL